MIDAYEIRVDLIKQYSDEILNDLRRKNYLNLLASLYKAPNIE